MGPRPTHTSDKKLAGISVQTSVLGIPIPRGWGRARVGANLIDYVAFTAIPTKTKTTPGGKGLGGSSTNTTYSYTASIILSIAQGPIRGVRSVYLDKTVFTDGSSSALFQAGLNAALGSVGQAPWGYLTSLFPARALGYSGIAYVYAADYKLNEGATLSNHTFEVDFAIQMPGLPDADPADIIVDALTNPNGGVPGWTAGLLGDLSEYSLASRANNLVLSPVLDQQVQASQFLQEILRASNANATWSEGVLKIRTLSDAPASAHGVWHTPDLTPQYDLTEDDFLEEVSLEITDQSAAYNRVQIKYLDRNNQYNEAVEAAYDLDSIISQGARTMDPVTMHCICDSDVARKVAQLLLQRVLYVRDIYNLRLPWDYIALEPMDYVTLTTTSDGLKLDRELVRIIQISEERESSRVLNLRAEVVPDAIASAALFPSHSAEGYSPNYDAAPGGVSPPLIFNAPSALVTTNEFEVWCAVASTNPLWGGCNVWISVDSAKYTNIGRVEGPARYGVLSSALPLHGDPDTTNTLSVDLSTSLGKLGDATTTEADTGNSLCYVGGELMSYRDATLTSAHRYDLAYLRRGQRNSVVSAHATGSAFARLDDAIFKFAYPNNNIGATIYIKFQSFNIFGRAEEDLSALTPYTIGLAPVISLPDPVTGLQLAGAGGSSWVGSQLSVSCNPSARATTYRFDIFKSDAVTLLRSISSALPSATYTADMAATDGPQRSYVIDVAASNSAGSTMPSSTIFVGNTAPATVTGVTATGGTTTGLISWTASTDFDLFGYQIFYHTATGFDPKTQGTVVSSVGNSITLYGLPAGTYYARVGARDPWTDAPTLLNLSAEVSFTITTGGGQGTPSGGGSSGGYNGRIGNGTQLP